MTNDLLFKIAFVLYSLVMIGVGVVLYRKSKQAQLTGNSEEFWIGSRKFSGWQMAISLTAGWLMLGWLGYGMSMIYQMGLSGLWILPLPWIILCGLVVLAVKKIRSRKEYSCTDALGNSFGKQARILSAAASVFVFIAWTGAELFMAGSLISPFLNISKETAMIIMVIPILIYTWMGGFKAIIFTDILQFSIMALFITALTIAAVTGISTASGISIIDQLTKTPTVSYGEGTMWNLFAGGFALPIILLVAYLPGWLVEQDLILRIQGAKSDSEAKKGAWLGYLLIGVFVITLPAITAFAAILLFPSADPTSASKIGTDATGIISAIIQMRFPIWAQVLMFLGLVAAQMSTIDTFSNAASVGMRDLNGGKPVNNQTARIISITAIVLGLIYGLKAESLTAVYTLSSGVLTAAVAIPLFALFIPKVHRFGIVGSIIAGALGTIIFYHIEYNVWGNSYSPKWLADTYLGYIIVGIFCSVIALIGGSIIGNVLESDNSELKPEQVEI